MLKQFYPDEYLDSTYQIDFEKYYKRDTEGLFLILIILWFLMVHLQTNVQLHCLND